MSTERGMKQSGNGETVTLANQYAMRHGIALGLFGIVSLAVFVWSFKVPFLSTLFSAMLLLTPCYACFLTLRFRAESSPAGAPFGFMRGFLHALFTGFYASVWIALVTFVYLQYFDHGMVFEAYRQSLHSPETAEYLRQSGLEEQIDLLTNGGGVDDLVDMMRSLGSAAYAAMSLYCAMFAGPFISVVIGLVCRRR